MHRPPLIPRLLLKLLLPASVYEAVAGDLEEDWHSTAGAMRPWQRRLGFWRIVLRSIADCWRDRFRGETGNAHLMREMVMGSMLHDFRSALRTMFTNPGFTAAAVSTLAVGIGATTAVFSIFNVVALQPLAYADPGRVVFVLGTDRETVLRFNLRVADFLDIRRDARSFEQVAAYSYLSANITGGDVPDRVQAYRVTANTFDMLGVAPALGRTFSAQEEAGRNQVAIISDGLWRRRFGGDPAAIGRTITINGRPYEIIGVMPRHFEYPVINFKGELWVPWPIDGEAARADRRTSESATVVARLKTDTGRQAAAAELRTIMARLAQDHPATNATVGAKVVPMGRFDDEQAGGAIYIPLVAVGLVLLLACANVANLLLARGVSRAREMALRAALGASRWRIVRQLLVESLLLAGAGAAAGVVLAHAALDALRRTLPELIVTTVPNIDELGIDRTTMAFSMTVSVLTSLAFGLLPAWRASRGDMTDALKERGRTGAGRGTRRLRTVLVAGEVALATMLLASAILVGRSYAALSRVSPGFTADGVLTMAISPAEDRYPTPEERRRFYEEVAARITSLPGVASASAVNVLPFSTYDRGTAIAIVGESVPTPGREPRADFRIVTPEYFATLEIPLVAGRPFDSHDRPDGTPVAIINQTFARTHFNGVDPIGRRIRLGALGSDASSVVIVGVAGDVYHSELTQVPGPAVFVPLAQSGPAMMMYAIRTNARVETLAVRNAVLEVDPLQPIYHVKGLNELVDDATLPQRTLAMLVSIFGAIALLLAAIGVYGVVSYAVTQQMPELGVRLALGATPAGLSRLVIRRCAATVGAGIVLGTGAALLVGGALSSLLYGVRASDPTTYVVAAASLALFGIGAGVVPAWRASTAEPLAALRE
jgi:putative ABC transport system permease protein